MFKLSKRKISFVFTLMLFFMVSLSWYCKSYETPKDPPPVGEEQQEVPTMVGKISGQVVDAKTGEPLPGQSRHWHPSRSRFYPSDVSQFAAWVLLLHFSSSLNSNDLIVPSVYTNQSSIGMSVKAIVCSHASRPSTVRTSPGRARCLARRQPTVTTAVTSILSGAAAEKSLD